jgi:hypothetical protein
VEDRLARKSARTAATPATSDAPSTTEERGTARSAFHKYKAKAVTIDGIRFASQAEGKRYLELKALEASGAITHLELQPKYSIVINGIKVCSYIGDFRYRTAQGCILEDVKGMITPIYRLKKKIVEAMYPGTTITEIGRCSSRSKSRKSIASGPKPKAGRPTKS